MGLRPPVGSLGTLTRTHRCIGTSPHRRCLDCRDLVISTRAKDLTTTGDVDSKVRFAASGPQTELQKAGFELLVPRCFDGIDEAEQVVAVTAMTETMRTGFLAPYTSDLLLGADLKQQRGASKPYTFIHIIRGTGASALQDIVLAPFLATPKVSEPR